jgi:hypothetical protein
MMGIVVATPLCLPAQDAPASHLNLVAPLQPLLAVLKRANVSGSLEFSGRCETGKAADWPHWRILKESVGSPLQVARETFADDPTMQVTQESDGTIRMVQNGVPTDLLNVKISHISFGSGGVPFYLSYSANSAARHIILETPEVVAYMTTHHIKPPMGEPASGGNTPPPSYSPHMAGSFDDLTVSQAMDGLLRSFQVSGFIRTALNLMARVGLSGLVFFARGVLDFILKNKAIF